ncbi:MAG: glycosyltransferase family 87 protein [Candidatus Limnocylindrales bacterium]
MSRVRIDGASPLERVPSALVPGVVAGAVPGLSLLAANLLDLPGRFNDFSSYWLAGRLVAAGSSPYDLAALAALGRRENLTFLVGGGYSYPPPFAVAMAPLAALPFQVAAWLFCLVSVLVFGLAVGAWLGRLDLTPRRRLVLALLAGAYPPVVGSLYFGQANLLVLASLALALAVLVPPFEVRVPGPGQRALRELGAGLALGLAGIVKLVPLALLVPLAFGRRWLACLGMVLGSAGSLGLALILAPASARGESQLSSLFEADGFWSNQSLNGLATRLTVPTERTTPLLPGLDAMLLGVVLICVLAGLTAGALWLARDQLGTGTGLGAALALALVAGLAAAPKDSFWNHAPALLAVGLLPLGRLTGGLRPRVAAGRRWILVGLGAWYGMAWLQALIDRGEGSLTRPLGALGSLGSSIGILGLLTLWLLLVCRLVWLAGLAGRAVSPIGPGTSQVSAR